MTALLAETFTRRDPPAVAVGLTLPEFESFVRRLCPKAAAEGHTIVWRDRQQERWPAHCSPRTRRRRRRPARLRDHRRPGRADAHGEVAGALMPDRAMIGACLADVKLLPRWRPRPVCRSPPPARESICRQPRRAVDGRRGRGRAPRRDWRQPPPLLPGERDLARHRHGARAALRSQLADRSAEGQRRLAAQVRADLERANAIKTEGLSHADAHQCRGRAQRLRHGARGVRAPVRRHHGRRLAQHALRRHPERRRLSRRPALPR